MKHFLRSFLFSSFFCLSAVAFLGGQSPEPAKGASFIFFGDSGTGEAAQQLVAQAIKKHCEKNPGACSFVLLLGDNFYPSGVQNVEDPKWTTHFVRPYGKLGLVFFPVLGNHDYQGNPQAQVDYSKKFENNNARWIWRMPNRYYTFKEGDVEFFALDTNSFNKQQKKWLIEKLAASTARWKVVYGHHPVFSSGSKHGDSPQLTRELFPILKDYQVDYYLAGHDHHLEWRRKDGVTFVISGAATAPRGAVKRKDNEVISRELGFAHLRINGNRAALKFFDIHGTQRLMKENSKIPVPPARSATGADVTGETHGTGTTKPEGSGEILR